MMSLAAQEAVDPPAAPRAGSDLRAARERLGWPIELVAAELRIRQPHLEALEAGRIDLLPGYAYAVGFMRSYAGALGLDPDEIGRRFKAEAAEVNRQTELAFPTPLPERGMPAGALVLLGFLLAIGAYAGWYRLSGEGKLPSEAVIPVPQHLASLAQPAMPDTPPRVATSPVRPARASPPPALAASSPAATTPPVAAGTSTSAASSAVASATVVPPSSPLALDAAPPIPSVSPTSAAASVNVAPPSSPLALDAAPPIPSVSPTSAAAAPVPPLPLVPPGTAATSTGASADGIVIQATADAWLEVRDANGGKLLNRLMHAGDTWAVPKQAGLVLTTGNAGGTVLVVDGVASPALGSSGAVRRNLPLDPDLVRAGKAPAPAPGSIQRASLRSSGQ